ncbi:hypothetical protein CDD83_993 [Cordyceps sp. RAO-2017]|nr:hypothetical protein CDD83_993 [Cordyceps sp. RAO-2017]
MNQSLLSQVSAFLVVPRPPDVRSPPHLLSLPTSARPLVRSASSGPRRSSWALYVGRSALRLLRATRLAAAWALPPGLPPPS